MVSDATSLVAVGLVVVVELVGRGRFASPLSGRHVPGVVVAVVDERGWVAGLVVALARAVVG